MSDGSVHTHPIFSTRSAGFFGQVKCKEVRFDYTPACVWDI